MAGVLGFGDGPGRGQAEEESKLVLIEGEPPAAPSQHRAAVRCGDRQAAGKFSHHTGPVSGNRVKLKLIKDLPPPSSSYICFWEMAPPLMQSLKPEG